jgi:uncharacterized protein (TIGR01777 family)
MHVAITGSSGLIGTALGSHLSKAGHQVTRVTRSGSEGIRWDPARGDIERDGFSDVDAVVHLAGAGIGDRRWTTGVKAEIRDSRVLGTRLLSTTLASLDNPPKVLLSASGIGYYGSRGDEILTEDSPPGEGFLAEVCIDWEAETRPAEEAGIRVAHLRTGLVLSPEGGALAKMLPLFKLGVGGKLGSGRQWWSSISLDDEIGIIEWLLTTDVSGPVNLTGPQPLTNADFTRALAKVLNRPALLPVPAFGPRILLGKELADELLFTSARVEPTVASARGYEFSHTTTEAALAGVLERSE